MRPQRNTDRAEVRARRRQEAHERLEIATYVDECVPWLKRVGFDIELMNDCGELAVVRVWARDGNDACYFAIDAAEQATGDATFAMNEWRPA